MSLVLQTYPSIVHKYVQTLLYNGQSRSFFFIVMLKLMYYGGTNFVAYFYVILYGHGEAVTGT